MIYLHKYHHGIWRGSHSYGNYQQAEAVEIRLVRIFSALGWTYELSKSPLNPRNQRNDRDSTAIHRQVLQSPT